MTEAQIIATTNKLIDDLHSIYALIDQAVYHAESETTDREAVAEAIVTIIEARQQFDNLEQQIEDLTHLARRMASQRQSAVESFLNGWEAGLLDLQDKLSRYEFDQLIDAIHQIENGDR